MFLDTNYYRGQPEALSPPAGLGSKAKYYRKAYQVRIPFELYVPTKCPSDSEEVWGIGFWNSRNTMRGRKPTKKK